MAWMQHAPSWMTIEQKSAWAEGYEAAEQRHAGLLAALYELGRVADLVYLGASPVALSAPLQQSAKAVNEARGVKLGA